MNCVFCGVETSEQTEVRKITVIAHKMCIAERMEELDTKDLQECLLYEDQIKFG